MRAAKPKVANLKMTFCPPALIRLLLLTSALVSWACPSQKPGTPPPADAPASAASPAPATGSAPAVADSPTSAAPGAPIKAAAEPPRFVDVTAKTRIRFTHHAVKGTRPGDTFQFNHYVHGSGVACGDIDNDGQMDLYFLDQDGPNVLYRNMGGLRFQDVTAGADVALADRVSTAAAFADMDNDGDQDLLVAGVRTGIAIMANDGSGRFESVSEASGLTKERGHITAVGLIDGDGDGLVDVFAGHNAVFTHDRREGVAKPYIGLALSMGWRVAAERSHYYRNLGKLRFEERSEESGFNFSDWAANQKKPNPGRMFWAGDAVVTDFEPDGKPDLIVSNMAGFDRYMKNLGDGRFENISAKIVTRSTFGAFGLAIVDHDGDGRLDVAAADMHSDMFLQPQHDLYSVDWTVKHGRVQAAKNPMMAKRFIFGNALYRNSEQQPWADASERAGVENMMPWGVIAADFDLDGDQDLFYPAGMGWPWQWSPDFFYLNRGDGRFDEALEKVGLMPSEEERYLGPPLVIRTGKYAGQPTPKAPPRSSRAAVACDLDNDGDQDLVIVRWAAPAQIFENRLAPAAHKRLVLELKGSQANRDAIGARVEVETGGRRLVQVVPGTSGYLSGPERRLFFGLGSSSTIDKIHITWPYGTTETLPGARFKPGPQAQRVLQSASSGVKP